MLSVFGSTLGIKSVSQPLPVRTDGAFRTVRHGQLNWQTTPRVDRVQLPYSRLTVAVKDERKGICHEKQLTVRRPIAEVCCSGIVSYASVRRSADIDRVDAVIAASESDRITVDAKFRRAVWARHVC